MFHANAGNIQKGHGIVFFDFNDDGRRTSIRVEECGPGTNGLASCLRIRANPQIPDQIGCAAEKRICWYWRAIRVRAENARHEEIVRYYHMDNKSGFGSAPFLAHIGLMDAVAIQGVDVFWPVSGCKTTYPAKLATLNVLDENQCSTSDTAHGSAF
jgi:hypothetical protein